jgi:acetyl-CoA carboxylase carboxyl transferase subunit beta
MLWFFRKKAPKPQVVHDYVEIKEDLWVKCPKCGNILYKKNLEASLHVCPNCNYHFRIPAKKRAEFLFDKDSVVYLYQNLRTANPLDFKDKKKYSERYQESVSKTGLNEAILCGVGLIDGIKVAFGIMDFYFMGGSMGSVVGESLKRLILKATQERLPLVIFSASGGARMQEGIFSLMQMAKVSVALAQFHSHKLPYISVLCDPTTGGVAASFAFQGDVIIAEPGALIGFAGKRVIEQTIKKRLPDDFQTAEFLLRHGMIDRIVPRPLLKVEISKLLDVLGFKNLD